MLYLVFFSGTLVFCQSPKLKSLTSEEFSVNAENKKHGQYRFFYNKKLQVKGFYCNGEKQGPWVYNIDPEYQILGFYKDNKKDSVWTHYLNGSLYVMINYTTGESAMFYSNGTVKSTSDSIDHRYVYLEYNEIGDTIKKIIWDSIYTKVIDYGKDSKITQQIIFKDDLPFSILNNKYIGTNIEYDGELINGTGRITIKIKNSELNVFYLSDILDIKNSKLNGIYKKYTEDGNLWVEGQTRNDYMVGIWKKYTDNGNLDRELDLSENDSLKVFSGKFTISSNPCNLPIYEEPPVFPAKKDQSLSELMNFLRGTIKYPEVAQEKGISGRVYISFTVQDDGDLSDIEIVRSVDESLDKEAYRVIRSMPYWRPGIQGSWPTKVKMSIPVNFRLE
jgi:TonB family protein